MTTVPERKREQLPRWPLLILAAPAGVATWSGWVGLGRMTGFGEVSPLPGIVDNFTIDTAITLPIGVEAYAAYALGAWLSATPMSTATRRFAAISAVGSLGLGMAGQVAYHLLDVAHDKKVAEAARATGRAVTEVAAAMPAAAPWWIVTVVSCLPVLVLGMGAALGHMLHRDRTTGPANKVTDADTASATGTDTVTDATVTDAVANTAAETAVTDTVADASVADARMGDRPGPVADDRPVTDAVTGDVPAPQLTAVADAPVADPVVTGSVVTGHWVAEPVADDWSRLTGQPVRRALAAAPDDRSSVTVPAVAGDRESVTGQELVLARDDRDALVLSWLSTDPDISGAEIARRLQVAPRTGQRLRDRMSAVLQRQEAAS